MRPTKKITEKILHDNEWSLQIALIMGVSQHTIKQQAQRQSVKLICSPLVDFYKERGYSLDEIIEKSPAKPKRVIQFKAKK